MAKTEEQIDWERQGEQLRFASPMDSESLRSASLLLDSSPAPPPLPRKNALGFKDLPPPHISLR